MGQYTLDVFHCGVCAEEFHDIEMYANHMMLQEQCIMVLTPCKALHNLLLPRFKPDSSKVSQSASPGVMQTALRVHTGTEEAVRWKCRVCALTFSRHAAFNNHYMLMHSSHTPTKKSCHKKRKSDSVTLKQKKPKFEIVDANNDPYEQQLEYDGRDSCGASIKQNNDLGPMACKTKQSEFVQSHHIQDKENVLLGDRHSLDQISASTVTDNLSDVSVEPSEKNILESAILQAGSPSFSLQPASSQTVVDSFNSTKRKIDEKLLNNNLPKMSPENFILNNRSNQCKILSNDIIVNKGNNWLNRIPVLEVVNDATNNYCSKITTVNCMEGSSNSETSNQIVVRKPRNSKPSIVINKSSLQLREKPFLTLGVTLNNTGSDTLNKKINDSSSICDNNIHNNDDVWQVEEDLESDEETPQQQDEEVIDLEQEGSCSQDDVISLYETDGLSCELCSQTVKTARILQQHMNTVHASSKPFVCSFQECGQAFKTKGSLTRHNRRHTGERPFVCFLCGRSFRESGTLQRHRQSRVSCALKTDRQLTRYMATLPLLQHDSKANVSKLLLKKEEQSGAEETRTAADSGEDNAVADADAASQDLLPQLPNSALVSGRLIKQERDRDVKFHLANLGVSSDAHNNQETKSCDTLLPDAFNLGVSSDAHNNQETKSCDTLLPDACNGRREQEDQQQHQEKRLQQKSEQGCSSGNTQQTLISIKQEAGGRLLLPAKLRCKTECPEVLARPGSDEEEQWEEPGSPPPSSPSGLLSNPPDSPSSVVSLNPSLIEVPIHPLLGVGTTGWEAGGGGWEGAGGGWEAGGGGWEAGGGGWDEQQEGVPPSPTDGRDIKPRLGVVADIKPRIAADAATDAAAHDTAATVIAPAIDVKPRILSKGSLDSSVCKGLSEILNAKVEIMKSCSSNNEAALAASPAIESTAMTASKLTTAKDLTGASTSTSTPSSTLASTSVREVIAAAPTSSKSNSAGSEEPVPCVFICPHCQRNFQTRSSLMKHLYTHVGMLGTQCSECRRSFSSRAGLVRHTVRHSSVRRFVCRECTAQFSHPSQLQQHLLSHSAHKTVVCDVCGRTFKTVSARNLHARSHSGASEGCGVCGRSFTTRGSLHRHARTHSGERPYACRYCHASFRDNGTLARHLKHKKPCCFRERGEALQNLQQLTETDQQQNPSLERANAAAAQGGGSAATASRSLNPLQLQEIQQLQQQQELKLKKQEQPRKFVTFSPPQPTVLLQDNPQQRTQEQHSEDQESEEALNARASGPSFFLNLQDEDLLSPSGIHSPAMRVAPPAAAGEDELLQEASTGLLFPPCLTEATQDIQLIAVTDDHQRLNMSENMEALSVRSAEQDAEQDLPGMHYIIAARQHYHHDLVVNNSLDDVGSDCDAD